MESRTHIAGYCFVVPYLTEEKLMYKSMKNKIQYNMKKLMAYLAEKAASRNHNLN